MENKFDLTEEQLKKVTGGKRMEDCPYGRTSPGEVCGSTLKCEHFSTEVKEPYIYYHCAIRPLAGGKSGLTPGSKEL